MNLSIIGFGKLGSAFAAVCVNRGHYVIGIDKSKDALQRPLLKDYPEPGVAQRLQAALGKSLTLTQDASAVANTDISFVIVPTPSQRDGAFDLSFAAAAMQEVGEAIKAKPAYHLVVLVSTVLPGDCEREIIPALEQASGKVIGDSLGFCYSPDFIAQGSIIYNYEHPDFILVGASDPQSWRILDAFFAGWGQCEHCTIIEAEIVKLSLNTYVTMKISFANMLAQLCEQYPGANVDRVTQTIAQDARINGRYLKGATPFGGPCFPRDARAMARVLYDKGLGAALPVAIHGTNQDHRDYIFGKVCNFETVAVLGLAYKTGTPITEESFGVWLAQNLEYHGVKVRAHDPMIAGEYTAQEAVNGADAVVITLPYSEYRALAFTEGQNIVDCWRIFEGQYP